MARGTIRKRGNSFNGRVKVKDAFGAWRDLSVSAATEAECERKLAELVKQSRRGPSSTEGRKTTVRELLDHWLELNEETFSPTNVDNNRSVIRKHFTNALGNKPIAKLTVFDLNTFYRHLVKAGGTEYVKDPKTGKRVRLADGTWKRKPAPLSVATVKRIANVLRPALQQACVYGWITENPAALASVPKNGDSGHRITPPTLDEVATLVDAAWEPDADWGLFVWLAVASGARCGEITALRWSRVDLDAGTLRIEFSIARNGVIKDTKTGNVRDAFLDAETVQLLREHRTQLKRRALAAGVPLADDPYVFSFDEDGAAPWSPQLASKRFSRLAEQVGLPDIRLHDLRHYSVTTQLDAGVPLATVAYRHGHAGGGKTTQAVYAHHSKAADQRAADVMASTMQAMKRGKRAG